MSNVRPDPGLCTSLTVTDRVERFFRDISENRLRCGGFTSVAELVAAIDGYVAHHNTNPKSFICTASARHPPEGHPCQQSLKFQTECNTTLDCATLPSRNLDLTPY